MVKKIVYASFDSFPSYKGASAHIHHTCCALSELAESLDILCLMGQEDNNELPKNARLYPFYFDGNEGNYLQRATLFSKKVFECMESMTYEGVAQFRDIWSGLAMINRPNLKSVFEVNALTSVELPEKYPLLTPVFINEIRKLEYKCLHACDMIITPSGVTKKYLLSEFLIPENKIEVIPNGGDIKIAGTANHEVSLPDQYIIYFGALQPWQGLDVLIRSLKYLSDYKKLKLVICSSVKEQAYKFYKKLAIHLGVDDKLILLNQVDKYVLHKIVANAKASVVPLRQGMRNVDQGCCPIKVLESMACKTPLIASELPVVKELAGENAFYFVPEDELDLSRCIRFVLDNEAEANAKAEQAFHTYVNNFTWEQHNHKLKSFYQNRL
jgi:glycosyltransferase involved in cell wall biosynthesis